ncbi:MAG: sulfurtransferase TusA family protein [Gammaproteobacteria bacterium]|nr:sulfurtransferase TusA family protein [Desulfobacterales bacterium]NIR92508.1 sulfurtransferase TusA family protein [Gammaproteobacteria bacterium]
MDKNEITRSLDTSGKCCPMPIVETNMAIKRLQIGEILEVVATDPGTRKDIPSWCERTGNKLLSTLEESNLFRFYVKKTR